MRFWVVYLEFHCLFILFYFFCSCYLSVPLLKESYRAQNSLELKLPFRSSPPFYVKQRILSPKGKKWTLSWLPAPCWCSLWPISRTACPRRLRENYSAQPWRTGPWRVAFHYMPIHTYSLLVLGQLLTNLTAVPSRLIKGDLFL